MQADPLVGPSGAISPPVLVVATTDDPATPYQDGVELAQQIGGVLLTHQGEGHTVVGQGVACVDAAVAEYLVDPQPPPPATTCASDPSSGFESGSGSATG